MFVALGVGEVEQGRTMLRLKPTDGGDGDDSDDGDDGDDGDDEEDEEDFIISRSWYVQKPAARKLKMTAAKKKLNHKSQRYAKVVRVDRGKDLTSDIRAVTRKRNTPLMTPLMILNPLESFSPFLLIPPIQPLSSVPLSSFFHRNPSHNTIYF
jgi:hypothetical protein